jgi:hypothetical protein
MKRLVRLVFIGTLSIAAAASGPEAAALFAFFDPTVRVSPGDRARLDNGEVVARVLPADDGHVAFFAAARLDAPADALLEWTRAIEALKRGPMVLAVGRLSNDIADTDLDALMLEKGEIDALKRCRVGHCDIKLAAAEIVGLQAAIRHAGADWRAAAVREFRRILLGRVRLHRERGLLALPPYADRGRGMSVGEAFSAMTARSPYLTRAFPDLVNSLLAPRREPVPAADAFYYWSRERYGAGKTVVTITYVRLLQSDRSGADALAVSAQLYASHYIDGALGVTAVICERAEACYLTYLNRTRVDLLGGLFGPLKRAVIEDRIRSDGPELMRGITRRLESRVPAEGGES